MKKVYIFFIFYLISISTYSLVPTFQWAKSAGSFFNDSGNNICNDASGNVFITGYFESPTITFGTITLTNVGYRNIFIVKYDPNGNVLWAKSAGGNNDDEGISICTDPSGNVFITGFFFSPIINFGNISLASVDLVDVFIAKYDSNGILQWAKGAGGTGFEQGNGISTDSNGNVFITGKFNSSSLNFGTASVYSFGDYDIFIAKYDVLGNVLWVHSAGGIQIEESNGISIDSKGNVFITGNFSSNNITFGSFTITKIPGGYSDIFITKYDNNGNVLWVNNAGSNLSDLGLSISNDKYGNTFITGVFANPSISFGVTTLTNLGLIDIYIVKYNSNGNVIWAKSVGGTSYEYGLAISNDAIGNVLLTGNFHGPTLTFGATTLINTGKNDIFIAKYDSSGNELWAKGVGDIDDESGLGISNDTSGNIFITGSFQSPTISFGTTTLTNLGNPDVFIAKLSSITGFEEMKDEISINIAPNPFESQTTIRFNSVQTNSSLKIIDVLGNEIKEIKFTGQELILEKDLMNAGIYFLLITDEKNHFISKKVIMQ